MGTASDIPAPIHALWRDVKRLKLPEEHLAWRVFPSSKLDLVPTELFSKNYTMSSLKYSLEPRYTHGTRKYHALIKEALVTLQQQTQHLNHLDFPGCTAPEIRDFVLNSHPDIQYSPEFEHGLLTELGRGCASRQWQSLTNSHEIVRYRAIPEEVVSARVRVYKRPSEGRLRVKTKRASEELAGAVNGLSLSSGAS